MGLVINKQYKQYNFYIKKILFNIIIFFLLPNRKIMATLFRLLFTLNAIMFAASNTLFSFGGKWYVENYKLCTLVINISYYMWKQDTGDVNGYLTSEFRQVFTRSLTKDFYIKH